MKKLFWIILLVLSSVSFLVDKQLSIFIPNNRPLILNKFFEFIINYLPAALFLAAIFAYMLFKKRKLIIPYSISLLASAAITVSLKYLIGRPRPFVLLALEKMHGISYFFDLWNSSFPSWHTVSLFLIIPFIGMKYKPYWLAVAVIIALSRIYSGVHYLSDVLFGALLGYLISKIALKYFSKE